MKGAIVLLFLLLVTHSSQAQVVAILDQGIDTSLQYDASHKFIEQRCFSYKDRFERHPPPHQGGFKAWEASLCKNGKQFDFTGNQSAEHPRNYYVAETGNNYIAGGSRNLPHSRPVSDSLYDFDQGVFHKHVQVYGYSSESQEVDNPANDNSGNYKTDGGQNIANALTFLAWNDTGSLSAVAIATVLIDRSQSEPDICTDGLGQAAVNRLYERGIPAIAGLLNEDIGANVKTWPNCLNNVIKVGSTRAKFDSSRGVGIGANGISYFGKDSIYFGSSKEQGNSLVSPRIAGAFSLLHEAVPFATVQEKIDALNQANSRTSYHRVGSTTRTKRYVLKTDLPEAIRILRLSYPDDIPEEAIIAAGQLAYLDTNEYGPRNGGSDSN